MDFTNFISAKKEDKKTLKWEQIYVQISFLNTLMNKEIRQTFSISFKKGETYFAKASLAQENYFINCLTGIEDVYSGQISAIHNKKSQKLNRLFENIDVTLVTKNHYSSGTVENILLNFEFGVDKET